jgi:hypothetical protein
LVAFTILAQGCVSRAIKEGIGTVRGAKGTFAPIKPLSAIKDEPVLAQYANFELGPIVDDLGGRTPAELWQFLPGEFQKALLKKRLPVQPGGKTLLVRGRVIHYESASTLGMAIGPLEEVIVRTELVDKTTGKVLAVGNCIGRTEETVNFGVQKKAEGLAKAFVAWIDAHYPKAGREESE